MVLSVNIKKRLNDFLLDAAFEARDETMGVLGASGSGKSLLLKCIAGIIKPDEGYIELNGKMLYDSEKGVNLSPQKRRVGYLFQEYALFPNMTVEKNIKCVLKGKKDKEIIAEYIKRFRLDGLENRYPSQLSGGQQQRVALARIFASNPDIIMLDEPFSALDSYLKWGLEQEMMEFLDNYNKTVLFISHNRNEVCRLCDRIVVMDWGKSEGPYRKKEFFERPKTLASAILSGCKNISSAKKLSRYAIRALDWNAILVTDSEVDNNITHVGIRAHHIELGEKDEENIISCKVVRKVDNLFSKIYLLDTGKANLRWELDKNVKLTREKELYIKIPKEKLILICMNNDN